MWLFWFQIALAGTSSMDSLTGSWTEFGCKQEQIVLKTSGKVTIKLWAGEEYGWLQQYHFWSNDSETLSIREKRGKLSPLIDQWTIDSITDTEIQVERSSLGGNKRAVTLTRCD